jgi:beta-phosphoglucomutase-like phosphatase (HAD superfamily)
MSLPALNLVSNAVAEVKRDVRRLRWFRRAFLEQVASVSHETHITFDVDTPRLAEAFIDWSKAFELQKPSAEPDKRRYVDFAAGLMLANLIRKAPLRSRQVGVDDPVVAPSAFWPEGYAYLAFCLNIRDAVLKQNYGEDGEPSDAIDDLRTWWSFRENVSEDPRLAIPFLEYFAGVRPEWSQPDNFRARLDVRKEAGRLGKLRLVHDGDLQPDTVRAKAALRPVLEASVSRVLLDIEVLTNRSDIYVNELTAYIQSHGVPIGPRETRARFLNAPLNLAMTHVALATRKICPSEFIKTFEERLAARYAAEIEASPALRSVLRELSEAGIEAVIVSDGDATLDEWLVGHLASEGSSLALYRLDSEDCAEDLAKSAAGNSPSSCLLLSGDRLKIAAAQALGMNAVGFAARSESRGVLESVCDGPVIDHFLGFPRPAS